MGSTFHGLEVGKRSLFAQQSALHTTGHNIANANTTGYTRQRVELQASNPISYPGLNNDRSPRQLGTGVSPSEIVRVREDYLDVQFRNEQKNLGYWESIRDTYSRIEELINEPTDEGLQKMMDKFWQSWQDLAKNPESLAARAVVRETGVALGDAFRHVMFTLDQMETDLTNVVNTKVNEINVIARQLGDLNDQISRLVPHGYQPNDLYDRRDALIDQLSKIVEVDVRPGLNGMAEVWMGGQQLVTGRTAQEVTLDPATYEIVLGGSPLAMTSGELVGIIEGRGRMVNGKLEGIIPSLREEINQYAVNFAQQLNNVHATGVNMDSILARKNDPNSVSESLLFFVDKNDPTSSPTDAASFGINPLILDSLNKIAAAKTFSEGDGTLAQDITAIKFRSITIGEQTSTLDDFYRNTIAQVGVRSQEAYRMSGNMETLVSQIENRRQSVSGVSVDEEMSNIIKYQQAYNAAARFVTTIDEVLDKVINGMGRVGL